MKSVSVITVNYNQQKATEELLASILEKNRYPQLDVIVVDNGSNNDPVPGWEKMYPAFSFIRSNENLGFAGGNNLGLRHCNSDYIFLINNDTIITEDLVKTLVEFLDNNPGYAMVSPKIRYHDQPDILQYAGFTKMNFFTIRNKCVGQFEKDNGQYDTLGNLTHYCHGAAVMIRKELIQKIGLMPENYFLYYEEMDWCEMFKRAGYKIGLCMKALIYHKESLATGKNSKLKEYYMNRNRLLFARRNANRFQLAVFFIYYITVLQGRYIINCISSGYTDRLTLFVKAISWNLTHSSRSKN